MVRREEQPQRARCTVLLDTRAVAYDRCAGPYSAFEWAVSGTASALVHMLERGFSVRLLTDTGNSVPGEGADGFAGRQPGTADAAGLMMDTLAVIDHSDGTGLSRRLRRAARRERGAAGGLLRRPRRGAGHGGREDAAAQRRRAAPSCWTASSWVRDRPTCRGPPDGAEERLRMLREAGWTALGVPPGRRAGGAVAAWRTRAHRRRPPAGGTGGGMVMSGRARLALCALAATLMASCALLPAGRAGDLARPGGVPAGGPVRGGRAGPAGAAGPAADRSPAQPLVTLLLLTLVFARDQAVFGRAPGPGGRRPALRRPAPAGRRRHRHVRDPGPAESDGIRLMVVGGVLLIGLAVDTLAVTFRSAAPAGLPLLALYSVAAGLVRRRGAAGSGSWSRPAAICCSSSPRAATGSRSGAASSAAPTRTPGPADPSGRGAPRSAPAGASARSPWASPWWSRWPLPAMDSGLLDSAGGGRGHGQRRRRHDLRGATRWCRSRTTSTPDETGRC
ncbi:hypothetical protein SCYAM73S_03241 [Streptomyces cyaneofuscatus]